MYLNTTFVGSTYESLEKLIVVKWKKAGTCSHLGELEYDKTSFLICKMEVKLCIYLNIYIFLYTYLNYMYYI